jgi:hypothetical protein
MVLKKSRTTWELSSLYHDWVLCIASRTLGGRRPKTGWRQGDFTTDISIIIHLYLDLLSRADAVRSGGSNGSCSMPFMIRWWNLEFCLWDWVRERLLTTAFNLWSFCFSAISMIFNPGWGKVMMISCGFEKEKGEEEKTEQIQVGIRPY